MPVRVSPTETDPTHHVSLRDRSGKTVGLILCDANGRKKKNFSLTPVDRTALKTTTGNSQYSDMQYPYSPIVEDDWSGGRGGLDFERDGTKFYDSLRMRTSMANKAFLGPQEQHSTGNRTQLCNLPGDVVFHKLSNTQRVLSYRFYNTANYTAALAWLIARRGGEPHDLTIAIHSDAAGVIDAELSSITVASTRMADTLSEWLDETISQALTLATYYWLVVYAQATDDADNYWAVAVKKAVGLTKYSEDGTAGSWHSASYDLYFRLTDANADHNCILFDYKEQHYAALSPATGAPKIYMNGDRGAADANTAQLTKLIDATKNWAVDQWKGCMVKITDGLGKAENVTYRTVTGNDASSLTVDSAWTITHDKTTEYVILGSNQWTEIAGHGLTAPITDLLVSTQGVIYCCMGDSVTVRALRAYNYTTGAGAWRDFDDATNCQLDETATTKASYITYKPQAVKIVMGSNYDTVPGNVSISVMSNVTVPAWGVALTWATPVPVGSRYRKMTRLEVYPDDSGNEAVWVGKVDRPWLVPSTGNPYPFSLREMDSVRSNKNFKASLVHNVYLYFSLGNGLERYYNGQLDDVGPNIGEGLPANRQGPIVAMAGYPGRFFVAIDAGVSGYSSVLMRDGNGWHEHYRAPKGQRITALSFQPIPGVLPDRLWMYVGNDLLWLPFPSDTTNELEDSTYLYTHEGAIELSRMHAGMFDVQKIIKIIKLWTDNLDEDVCWLEVDYRLNENTHYTPFETLFKTSPSSEIDLSSIYGLAGNRLQLRIRFYTADASKTPVLLATNIEAVMRISIKNVRPLTFRLEDHALTLNGEADDFDQAAEKMAVLQDWADDTTDTMLIMHSISKLYDNKLVFLNPLGITQKRVANAQNPATRDRFVCTTTVQDA